MQSTPAVRVSSANERAVRRKGDYVLYWMIAARRTTHNFALDRALEHARDLERPLVILEPLRAGYRWASDRLHRFAIDGMADNARALALQRVIYHPYVEPEIGAGKGLLAALAERACVVVTDEYPCFFLPRMVARAASVLDVRVESVDSNGLLPLRASGETFSTAHAFRRHLQRTLAPHLEERPKPEPLAEARLVAPSALSASVLARWPRASDALLQGDAAAMHALPIDHTVAPAAMRGGARAAKVCLQAFLKHRLPRYAEERSQPESDASSHLSPYLHFGHLSAHAIFDSLMDVEGWSRSMLSDSTAGKRSGWWGLGPSAEAFLDQVVTWRELGFNFTSRRSDYDRFESLPEWAQKTLDKHSRDRRSHLYSSAELELGATHDPLWNAAANQLRTEGRIHNYLRMLWGKKILQWTESPRRALEIMIELNNKYALDGRDPNSYSGIFWVLGRYDRAWGPERPVFGTVRYMTSENTQRKFDVEAYVRRYVSAAR